MIQKKISKEQAGLIHGYRSGLEDKVVDQLRSEGIDPKYEKVKLAYRVEKNCIYSPDFPLTPNLYIETKGRFQTADRMKMLLVKAQHPDIEFRFVFSNSRSRISKASKTTYGAWCDKNGFKYADKLIPQEWIQEIKEIIKCSN